MYIDVNKIQSTRFDFDRELDLTVLTPADGGELSVLSCRLAGYIENEERGKRLSALLDAELLITCGRCLEPFKFSISSKFSLILVSKIKTSNASERELTRDELSLFPTSEGKLELEELAREQIHLNIPLKLLCRPDCQGLCASCGVDKNNIQCECVSETIDLRLAQLLEIKKKFGKPE
jgi:uncharacterized protein